MTPIAKDPPEPSPRVDREPLAATFRRAVAWDSLAYAAAGLVVACLLTLPESPLLHNIGWLLRSIFHEGGHTLAAWSVGVMAIPRIAFDGHQPYTLTDSRQFAVIALIAWAGLASITFRCVQMRFLWRPMLAATLLYPFVAFNETRRQLFIILMGHGGELLIAGVFFWRANTGLFTGGRVDRVAYAVVAWVVVFSNIGLCWGILFDPRTRQQYLADGQITNDYAVAAYDLIGSPHISTVVVPMLFLTIAVYPLALLAQRNVFRD